MPRNYKAKGLRGQWTLLQMQLAVNDVLQYGRSVKGAARMYSVPRQTLHRHVEEAKKGNGVQKALGRPRTLTDEQEEELVSVILEMERRLFGLTLMDVRRLVFKYCEINNIPNTFNREARCAGEDWMTSFLKKHRQLSLRTPEATSLARASGFNKEKVGRFFDAYESLVFDQTGSTVIPASQIYNADESGFTVCYKPGKVLAEKGKRSVGAVTSLEKGKTITVLCCVSGTGQFIPPMIIFPRVKMVPAFLDHAPAGTLGVASKTGWITETLFYQWFLHFVKHAKPSPSNSPTLLILDGHYSHVKNLEVIEQARKTGVIILSLPSHCTHRMQPLDVSFFKSLNVNYNKAVQTWHRQHPGRAVTESQFGELFNAAYGVAATVKNAASGFRKSGIFPFNREIFSDDDFIGAQATDKEIQPSTAADMNKPNDDEPDLGTSTARSIGAESVDTSTAENREDDSATVPADAGSVDVTNLEPASSMSFKRLIQSSVIQTADKPTTRKRKVQHAAIITASPYKRQLEEDKRTAKNPQKVSAKKAKVSRSGKNGKKRAKKVKNTKPSNDGETWICTVCSGTYGDKDDSYPHDDWQSCCGCYRKFHETCAETFGVIDDDGSFTCKDCL